MTMYVPASHHLKLTASGPTRRSVLAGIGGAAALAAIGLPSPAHATSNAAAAFVGDDFDALRLARGNWLTGVPFDYTDPKYRSGLSGVDSAVRAHWQRVDRSPDRRRVFLDRPFRDLSNPADTTSSLPISDTYTRLYGMARAWATPGCTNYQNPDVLATVLAGLKTAHDYGYNAGIAKEYNNWWDFEIGGPTGMLNALTLIYDHVDPADLADYLATVDRFVPDPRYNMHPPYTELSTGANRGDLSLVVSLRGILGKSEAKIIQGREAMGELFAYTTSGDGLYRDGSYIHHDTIAYTGGYGLIMLVRVTDLLALLNPSPWRFAADRGVFLDTVERMHAPMIFNNQMMEMVRGRSLSRFGERGHLVAHKVLERVLVLAESIEGEDPERANQWRAMCKGWLERDTYDDILNGAAIPTISVVSRLRDNAAVQPAPEPVAFNMFAGMARAVHRRPGWALGIAMASKRVGYYETGANENVKGFHTGEGATYLYNDADNGQFEDEYWPTVDMYRIPGITLNKMPLPNKTGGEWGVAHPKYATWVGGVSFDGRYGAVGMDLEGIQHSTLVGVQPPLSARKSWFCFDSYVIALGAGITDVSGYPVETIVENRSLHTNGTNALILDGEVQPTTQGWSETRRVHWAHLEGVGGYVFPRGGAELHALREERTGRYQDIGSAAGGPYTRRFVTMWFDHGGQPDGASYAYLLLPNATPEQTRELAENHDFVILANTADLQAVLVPELGLSGYNFFSAGRAAQVMAHQPCSVMVRFSGSELAVAVADPTQLLSQVELELAFGSFEVAEADPTVQVQVSPGGPVLRIDTSAMDGATHRVRFVRR